MSCKSSWNFNSQIQFVLILNNNGKNLFGVNQEDYLSYGSLVEKGKQMYLGLNMRTVNKIYIPNQYVKSIL